MQLNLTMILCGLIGLGIGMKSAGYCNDLETRILRGIMFGMIGCLAGAFVSLPITLFTPGEYEKVSETQLVAFRDGQSVKGSFIFGINGEDVYRYYTQKSDGGLVLNRIEADKVTIYEEKRNDGVLLAWRWVPVGKWRFFALKGGVEYKFLVPKRTVVRKYVADLN